MLEYNFRTLVTLLRYEAFCYQRNISVDNEKLHITIN